MQDTEPAEDPLARDGKTRPGDDAVAKNATLFTLRASRQGKESFVALSGELDLSSAPQLSAMLVTIFSGDRPRRLVLDLSHLIYLDSTGLSVFVTTQKRAVAEGIEFCLANPNLSVRRLLQITALDQIFQVVDEAGAILPPLPPRDFSRAIVTVESDEASPSP